MESRGLRRRCDVGLCEAELVTLRIYARLRHRLVAKIENQCHDRYE